MSEGRNEAFKNSVLFHGTVHTFNEGDIVEPRGIFGHAYATTDLDAADRYSRSKVTNKGEERNRGVYHVEPLEGDEPETTGSYVISKQGFRVVRRVRLD